MRIDVDVAVVGSGFGGSLVAMVARRLGFRVALLERGRHPRFAIGESSTPLANLLLEELAGRYDLPMLRSLSKWGSWQEVHPAIACGLKRGFTFYHHPWDAAWEHDRGRRRQLLVAASPHDRVADTHWYRPDFDAFLMGEARRLGAVYFDEVRLMAPVLDGAGWRLGFRQPDREGEVRARFLLDASGPRGFLFRELGLGEATLPGFPATQALYTHFAGVHRIEELGVVEPGDLPPYPVDDAALHHVFDGGWIWVLRFNNGLTSAGVAMRGELAESFELSRGAAAWRALLDRLPMVRRQFAAAEPTLEFFHQPRVSFRAAKVAGPGWALLPSAAGFVDPLLSTGFPLTLLGVERLGRILEEGLNAADLPACLADYEARTLGEVDLAAELVGALYSVMDDFELFRALSRLYFAAASYSETVRRLGRPELADGFLLQGRPGFRDPMLRCCRRVAQHARADPSPVQRAELLAAIRECVEPVDVAGLNRSDRRHWHPFDPADLYGSADKVGASAGEIGDMLRRCGVVPG